MYALSLGVVRGSGEDRRGLLLESGWSRRPSGYTISVMIQSFVPKAWLTKYMGALDVKSRAVEDLRSSIFPEGVV